MPRVAASVLPPSLSPRGLRVLVCGGRDCTDEEFVWTHLDRIHAERGIWLVIEGGQRTRKNGKLVGGVDLHACRWSYRQGLPGLRFDADWHAHGKAAGPIRNQRMLDEGKPDLVVAFPGGKGTADMMRRARAAGVEVIEVADAG
jgi:hypothetical protein